MAGLFHVCQGTCLCAASAGDGYGSAGKNKVLYCYGEVSLQKLGRGMGCKLTFLSKIVFLKQKKRYKKLGSREKMPMDLHMPQ